MNRQIIASTVAIAGLASAAAAQCGSCGTEQVVKTDCGDKATQLVSVQNSQPSIVEIATSDDRFTTLVALLKAADMVEALQTDDELTVFAPTNAAFAKLDPALVETLLKPENKKLLQNVLKYHVVKGEVTANRVTRMKHAPTLSGQRLDIKTEGGKVNIDKATVTAADVQASNGVIHVIDTVLVPETKNLVEVAQGAGQFSTLIAAAKAADLVPVLTGDDAYTILAPTDEAFKALGSTVQDLLKPENKEKLKSILLYHVIPGRVYSDQVKEISSASSAEGSDIRVRTSGDQVRVNDATVVKADIEAANGVIHVIDKVIMPPTGSQYGG